MEKKIIIILVVTVIVIIIVILYFIQLSNDSRMIRESIPIIENILVETVALRPGILSDTRQQRIPKIIMQTNASSKVPKDMLETIQTILNHNPEYTYIYFTDEEIVKFLDNEYGYRIRDAYHDLIPGAYKADLFRYCFLYKYGGVYIDTGMVSLMPLKTLIGEKDEFIAPEDDNTHDRVYNAFICCVPKHPIIEAAIIMCLKNIEVKSRGIDMLDITGPILLGRAFTKVTSQQIIPNKKYNDNIRIIQHLSGKTLHGDGNIVGEIYFNNKAILKTKYPTYYLDRHWYHTKEHYGVLYNRNEIYHSVMRGERRDDVLCPPAIVSTDKTLKSVMIMRKGCNDLNYKQKIPKIIMQTNEENEVPIRMQKAMKTILEQNPEYEYIYFDEKSRKQFLKEYFDLSVLNAYETLIPGAYKADLFRYCFLYEHGGVYLDSGMVSFKALRHLINENDEFIAPEDNGTGWIYNAFICSIPKNPIFSAAISKIIENVRTKNYTDSTLKITGPVLLGETFKEMYGDVHADTLYTDNVKLISHRSARKITGDSCTASGELDYHGVLFFKTKYENYYPDMSWYHKRENYDTLWNLRSVFN
jgi:mannosyltransferase OCH1-like enzyme